MQLRIGACLILAFVGASMANAQAFGIQMGDPVSKYGGKRHGDTDVYVVTAPNPNPEFESYMATAVPGVGICKVIGIGKTYRNDDYGTSAQASFNRIKNALVSRYGKSKDFDFLRSGALWDEPREWVWSIYKEERNLTSFWDADEGSRLPAGLVGVMLDTKSVNPSSGAYLSVAYEFQNLDRCIAATKQSDQRGL